MTKRSETVTIPIQRPHSNGQFEVLNYSGNAVVFAGRRWGKTQVGVTRLMKSITKTPGLYWWIGINWRSASMKRAWRLLSYYTRILWNNIGEDAKDNIREADKELRWPGGSEIWMRSAEKPESLAGEGLCGVVLDEFTLMRERVWSEYIEATLLDLAGWALFLGVPKGNNWGAHLWRAANGREGWTPFHFTTYQNPFLDTAAIDEIRSNLSERLFQQEYLAQITDDAGGVFRKVMDATTAEELDRAKAGARYVMGVDWGKHNDFTVLAVLDAEGELVYLDRFNRIDYTVQVGRLKALYEKFRPSIIAERNSMGEPLIEQLQRDGLRVEAFTTTNASKAQIMDALALAFERGKIRILPDPVLIGELQAYEMQRLPSGTFRYSAPAGSHDDCVMALALAWSGINKGVTAGATLEPRREFGQVRMGW